MEDYFETLGVDRAAGREEITAAYRRLCKVYHSDVNSDPAAAERMKRINAAYGVLKDESRRSQYESEAAPRENPEKEAAAKNAVKSYFSALMEGDAERAFSLLSPFDRLYVTFGGFKRWRESVDRLFSIRQFSVSGGEREPGLRLGGGKPADARKFYISITERSLLSKTTERYFVSKCAVEENGSWSVFLGHRDLNEIVKSLESLSAEHERGEMERQWEQFCAERCRELDMLSLPGLLREARRELYRHKRYRQPVAVCCVRVLPGASARGPELLETAAAAVVKALRETDIPAYIGDGVFAVLFAELKKKHAGPVAKRLASEVGRALEGRFGRAAAVTCVHAEYEGGELEPYIKRLAAALK